MSTFRFTSLIDSFEWKWTQRLCEPPKYSRRQKSDFLFEVPALQCGISHFAYMHVTLWIVLLYMLEIESNVSCEVTRKAYRRFVEVAWDWNGNKSNKRDCKLRGRRGGRQPVGSKQDLQIQQMGYEGKVWSSIGLEGPFVKYNLPALPLENETNSLRGTAIVPFRILWLNYETCLDSATSDNCGELAPLLKLPLSRFFIFYIFVFLNN